MVKNQPQPCDINIKVVQIPPRTRGQSRSLANEDRPPPRQLVMKYKNISRDVVRHQLVSVNSSNNTST